MSQRLILASASPRRSELLKAAGIPFEVIVSEAEETNVGTPEHIVLTNAYRKGEAVFASHPDAFVLAADTVVAIDGIVFGKPKDEKDAKQMLTRLSGNWHEVLTGVQLLYGNHALSKVDKTLVHFMNLSEKEIDAYIQTKEPFDKAGAYAIQGIAGMFIDRITGSFSNVIGLPMSCVRTLLTDAGFSIFGE